MQQNGNNGELLVAKQLPHKANEITGKRMDSKKKLFTVEAQVVAKRTIKLI